MRAPLTLCFIGGWGSTAEVWRGTLQALAGPREASDSPYAAPHFLGWQDCVQDWPDALTEISSLPGRCLLVGWSLGALFALRAALDFSQEFSQERSPELHHKIAAMVLVSATPCLFARNDFGGIDPRILAAMQVRVARNAGPVLDEFARQCAASDAEAEVRAQTCERYLQQARQFSAPELAAGLQALASLDMREHLAEIRVPCRIVHGACDQIVPLYSAQFLAAQLPRAELHVLEGCGHALPFTSPARIALSIVSAVAAAGEP